MAGSRRRYELGDPELDACIEALVARSAPERSHGPEDEWVRQMLVTCLRLLRDGASSGDLKLVNSTLKELRHAFRVFAPYRTVRKVAVFGSSRTPECNVDWQQAHRFAERMVENGWMVITGAGEGIMGAAQGGAGRAASFGVNIRLPFEQRANAVIAGDAKCINFRYFFTRKVTFVKEAHAIALFPGGFGTHDEGFEALTLIQTGKSEILPVVFVDAPGGDYWRAWKHYVESHLCRRSLISEQDLSLFRVTDSVEEAVQEIVGFYRNYHSSRTVGERLVLRVHSAPTAEQLEELNRSFADLLCSGSIESGAALPEEGGEVAHLPRVWFHFDRRSMGRLRQLIDRLNQLAEAPARAADASPHEIVAVELSPEQEHAEEEGA